MSRVGKNPITVPNSVNVGIVDQLVTVKGNLGELTAVIADDIEIDKSENLIVFKTRNNSVTAKKMWGTTRSIVNNLILGVSDGFTKNLEINGVGYRAQIQGQKLQLSLGFSHDINYQIPDNINIICSDQTHITISGMDKQKVGQIAAEIRSFRPPEPYKGKGIRYVDEYLVRKEGKKK